MALRAWYRSRSWGWGFVRLPGRNDGLGTPRQGRGVSVQASTRARA